MENFLEGSSPLSNNFSLYFQANDRKPYHFTYFLALGSIEYGSIAKLEERVMPIC